MLMAIYCSFFLRGAISIDQFSLRPRRAARERPLTMKYDGCPWKMAGYDVTQENVPGFEPTGKWKSESGWDVAEDPSVF